MKYIGNKSKIASFTDLIAWKETHQLVLIAYKMINKFPKKEQFALSDQMRRCAISISSNISEGFSRQSKKEKLQFYYTAKGSLTELQNQLLIARDVKYLPTSDFNTVAAQTITVGKLLTGLIKSIKSI